MKIFISWSGERSKALASALKTWLGDVIQSVDPWMSDHDIQAGARWSADLDEELKETHFGVLCLTRENLDKPWLLFEAGSLEKSMDIARVVPFRLDVSATDVKPPLSQFQGVDATKDGTFKLVQSINKSSTDVLPFDRLERLFDKFWPDLDKQISEIREQQTSEVVQSRDDTDYLKEILELVRQLAADKRPTTVPNQMPDEFVINIISRIADMQPSELDEYIDRADDASDRSSNAERAAEIARAWKKKIASD